MFVESIMLAFKVLNVLMVITATGLMAEKIRVSRLKVWFFYLLFILKLGVLIYMLRYIYEGLMG